MHSCLWKRFRAPASANLRKPRFASSSPAGNGNPSLRAVARVDAHVFCGEVAGPITRRSPPRVQIQYELHMFFEQAIADGPLVEIQRLATAQNRDAGHLDIYQIWIEFHSRAARGGENAAPVRIAARKSGLHQRGRGNRLRDLPRGGFGLCTRTAISMTRCAPSPSATICN